MDDLASLLRMSGCLVVDSRLKFFQTVVFYVFVFFPECEIYAETEIGSGMIDGNELFGIFGGKIVCAEKQVEAGCAYVENGSHGATHIGNGAVEGDVERR